MYLKHHNNIHIDIRCADYPSVSNNKLQLSDVLLYNVCYTILYNMGNNELALELLYVYCESFEFKIP